MNKKKICFYADGYDFDLKHNVKWAIKRKNDFIKKISFLNKKLNDEYVLEALLGEHDKSASFGELMKELLLIEENYEKLKVVGKERQKFDAIIDDFKNNYADAILNYFEKLDLPFDDKARKMSNAYYFCCDDERLTDKLFPTYKKYMVERATLGENKLQWEDAGEDWASAKEYLRGATCFINADCYVDACRCYEKHLKEDDYDSQEEKKTINLIYKYINEWIKKVYAFLQNDSVVIKREWEVFAYEVGFYVSSIDKFIKMLSEDYFELDRKLEIAKKISEIIGLAIPYEGEFAGVSMRKKEHLDYCIAKGKFVVEEKLY